MKKQIVITCLLAMVAVSSFAQGTIAFKTTVSKSAVLYSTDGTSGSLAYVATDGTAGSLGTVSYELYSAPNGTALGAVNAFNQPTGGSWVGTAVGAVTYANPGVVNSVTLTMPASSGAAGGAIEIYVYAYTGTLAAPTAWGYTGEQFNGNGAYNYNAIAYTTGSSTGVFSNGTGNPGGSPATSAVPLTTGPTAFGTLVLTSPVPEPSTIALGGLGAAALLLFRRRK